MDSKLKGFTLVEMLITLVILTSVLLLATQGYASFSSRWDGQLGRFQKVANDARSLLLVKQSLNGIRAYVTVDNANKPRLYFEGNINGFVAVTNSGAFRPGAPAVIRLQLVAEGNSGYRLEYQEWPMVDNYLLKVDQQVPFSEPIVLMTDLVNPRFDYFGVESLSRYNGISTPKPQWFEGYSSVRRQLMPQKIRLSLSESEMVLLKITEDRNLLSKYNGEFRGA
ncbi:PulJ/GspJ family protein [Ferrimonas aestuarii]|uniref:Prepilin-type N-terminal cleavage/methylation domain-containing protein n=1 Tax=Ferrimonas aestuarii TaxID=2569539 RepID=A0A4U1BLW8_9GAMM|nr:prepilin-type N-terminal cleavage/methylation domain-containing protein [Ferrimonas aestuarii]TKB53946.1 prepilin-type N-terminal cleavage/methylation domain-containing protein [Ferrimonas aestuarii]